MGTSYFATYRNGTGLLVGTCGVLAVAVVCSIAGCGEPSGNSVGVRVGDSFHSRFGWKPDVFFKDPGVVALCRAIEVNDLAQIDQLIANGVDVNATGEGNMTPLLWAFPDNQLARFRRLVEHGANPNVVVTTSLGAPSAIRAGDSVIHLCARTHFPGYFEAVLDGGGDPNLKDGEGSTVLQAIIVAGVPDAERRVRLALDRGADINAYGRSGATPVFDAVSWFGQYDVALLLLERGADPLVHQKDQLPNAIHRVLIEERDSARRTESERGGIARIKKWLEVNGYDLVTAKADVDRWATWGKMSPDRAARLRKTELMKRKETTPCKDAEYP